MVENALVVHICAALDLAGNYFKRHVFQRLQIYVFMTCLQTCLTCLADMSWHGPTCLHQISVACLVFTMSATCRRHVVINPKINPNEQNLKYLSYLVALASVLASTSRVLEVTPQSSRCREVNTARLNFYHTVSRRISTDGRRNICTRSDPWWLLALNKTLFQLSL